MRDEESDLSFADFGSEGVARRRYASLGENAAAEELANPAEVMARREGSASQRSWLALRGRRPLRDGSLCLYSRYRHHLP
jgi:hypothetical protein